MKTLLTTTRVLLFSIFSTIFAGPLGFAADSCRAVDVTDRPTTKELFELESMKNYQTQYAQHNIANFCERNMLLRFIRANTKVSLDTCFHSSQEDLENAASLLAPMEKGPWQLSITPTKAAKEKAANTFYSRTLLNNKFQLAALPYKTNEEKISFYVRINKLLDSLKPTVASQSGSMKSMVRGYCATQRLLWGSPCENVMQIIRGQMLPRGADYQVVDINLWKRVLGSDRYDEGLKNAVLKISSLSMPSDNNNVFDDIKNGFLEAGFSFNEAETATWDILGFTSSHGPAIGYFVTKIEGTSPVASHKARMLGYISALMAYYDYLNIHAGKRMYSYPKNIISTCDNSKSYHFWMSAYLARSLVKDSGLSIDNAAAGAFLAEKAYQVNRNLANNATQGHFAWKIFTYPVYDPVHEVIRIDLAYSAAGALFGAHSTDARQKNRTYDVNAGLVALLKDSDPQPPEKPDRDGLIKNRLTAFFINTFGHSPDIISNYIKWNMVFSPDTAFHAIKGSED